MRISSVDVTKDGADGLTGVGQHIPATLRLLQAERSEDIFPILLEEIVKLGAPRAMVLQTDFETGEVAPVAEIKCTEQQLAAFRTSLYSGDHPLVQVFHSLQPAVLPKSEYIPRPVYVHPIMFRQAKPCWEAERERTPDCLAVSNFRSERRLELDQQVCRTCQMRAYAAIVVIELRKFPAPAKELTEYTGLVSLANRYLSRLFKIEHYQNRMRDMEVTIGQMNTVMESMADPVILTDTRHQVIMQNRAAERFFKLPQQPTEGFIRAVELNNMLFTAALSSMAMTISQEGETHRDLTLVDASEGEELLFEAVSVPSFTREGLPTGYVTVMRDVTDLRRADMELQANYERLRAAEDIVRQDRDRLNLVIENVGDPIVVCDKDAKIVLLDPLALQLFAPRASGAPADINIDPLRVKNQAVLDAYITKFTYSFEDKITQTLKFSDPAVGTEIEYDARSGKIFDDRGQVAYSVTVLRDFSSIRKLEQLKTERRMLEIEKFASAGRLAATIAHEVNNPMEAIKNSIYLLANKVKPEANPIYDILKSETERVARIVRQMLGLYRNQEAVKPVDINGLLEDTLLLLARQLQRANVEVVTDLRKVPDAVVASDQLRQVFSNMVINAKDAMPNGGKLRVRTRHVPGPDRLHGFIRILLADTGTGIPADIVRTIFEPFVTTKGEKGTGLGLWIVKGIIANHGGRIAVRSKVGQGTVFKIDIPVVKI
ncbi:MAG TPA: ATP-binding protein [Terriglobales bacterium]|nr:ATP-binding protein [Terriglobales bacterium]